jgi:hypothetical protein
VRATAADDVWIRWDRLMACKPRPELQGAELIAAWQQFNDRYRQLLAEIRRQVIGHYGLRAVPVGGSVKQGMRQGFFCLGLADGTTGYFQRHLRDCLRAGLACLVQTPMHELPAFERHADSEDNAWLVLAELGEWQQRTGVQLVIDDEPPLGGRWIGVASNGDLGHCLLMVDDECLFDCGLGLPGWGSPVLSDVDTIDYGIAMEVN